jgi:uncharacterized membrane protein (UPF0127 family)
MQIRKLLILLAVLAACRSSGPTARIHAGPGTVDVTLEVASTPETLQRGLMYRQSLADGHGMLFIFAQDSDHEFWMKNTYISLDLVYISADGKIVGIHANATPLSEATISVGRPSRYVLEVPAGYTARRGIAPGDRVELLGVSLNPPIG